MALQSFISRIATYKFVPEVSRHRVEATFRKLDGRRYIRSPISSRIEVGWQDERGWQKQMQTRGINLSSTGASVMSPEPIAVGSAVYLNSKELQLMGSATVRHCTAQKSKFLIGLEFRGSLVRTF